MLLLLLCCWWGCALFGWPGCGLVEYGGCLDGRRLLLFLALHQDVIVSYFLLAHDEKRKM
jgi:hypothetical protein